MVRGLERRLFCSRGPGSVRSAVASLRAPRPTS